MDQLNKLDEKAFQQLLQHKVKKWLIMAPELSSEGVEVVDMAAFVALGRGDGTGGERPAIEGAVPFWTIKELPALNPAFELLARIIL